MNRNLRSMLKAALHQPQEVSIDHLEETIAAAQSAYRAVPPQRRIGFMAFLLRQLRFTGALVWAMQGAALLLVCLGLGGRAQPEYPVYGISTLLCCCAVLAGMTILPVWARAHRHHMLELESSTRFSLPRLMLAQLIVTAISNLIMLAIAVAVTGRAAGMEIASVIWTLLLPYLMSCLGCAFLMDRVRADLAVWLCVALGICLVTGFYMLFRALALAPPPAASLVWKLLCPAVFALLSLQLGSMLRRASTMEPVIKL